MTTDKPPSSPRVPPVLFALAFVGGYADAGSYLAAGVFTGHVTGNAVLTMVYAARGEWAKAGTGLLAVTAFLAGTAAGGRGSAGRLTDARRLTRPLLAEAVLLAAAAVGRRLPGPAGEVAFVACLCLALRLQNGALQRLGHLGVHTTYMTGMATKLTDAARPAGSGRTGAVAAGLVASFAAGALAGGLLTAHGGLPGFGAVLVPVAVAVFLSVRQPGATEWAPTRRPASPTGSTPTAAAGPATRPRW